MKEKKSKNEKSNGVPGFEETLTKMLEIQRAKNHDYAGFNNDPFKNFKMVEQFGVCSVEQGIIVRMTDKLSRITNLIKTEAAVNDEKITDTLIDLANYSIILKCYIDYNHNKTIKSVIFNKVK